MSKFYHNGKNLKILFVFTLVLISVGKILHADIKNEGVQNKASNSTKLEVKEAPRKDPSQAALDAMQRKNKRSKNITKEILVEMMEYQKARVEKKHGPGIVPPGIENLPDLPEGYESVPVKQKGSPIIAGENSGDNSSIVSPV